MKRTIEYQEERLNILEKQIEEYKKEINILRSDKQELIKERENKINVVDMKVLEQFIIATMRKHLHFENDVTSNGDYYNPVDVPNCKLYVGDYQVN